MVRRTLRNSREESFAACGGVFVKASFWWSWRGYRQLIEMQGRKLAGDKVRRILNIAKTVGSGYGELNRVVQPRVEKGALSMHLQIGDECVPAMMSRWTADWAGGVLSLENLVTFNDFYLYRTNKDLAQFCVCLCVNACPKGSGARMAPHLAIPTELLS